MTNEKQNLTFISYSKTSRGFASELAKSLKAAGFKVWLDQLDIPTGARWDDEVEKALTQCEIFMVILTQQSIASHNVKDEIGYAIDSNKRIMPILLENVNIPFRLRRFQYVDFTNKSNEEGIEAAKELLRKIMDDLSGQEVPLRPAPVTTQHPEADRPSVPKTDPNILAQRRLEAIQKAREKEQQERSRPAVPPAPAVEKRPSQPQSQPQSRSKLLPIIVGVTLVAILCLGVGGWAVRTYIFPPTHTAPPPPPVPTTEVPTLVTPPTTIVNTETPTEVGPTTVPTITPLAPQEPTDFIVFYFNTVARDKDFPTGWKLQTTAFQEKKSLGWDNYLKFWGSVKSWELSSVKEESKNQQRALVLITYTLYYNNSTTKPSLLDGVRYCLLWNEGIRTWNIDLRENCP